MLLVSLYKQRLFKLVYMKLFSKSLLIYVLLFAYLGNAQRKEISLNKDWQFTEGYKVRKNSSTRIDIPHTWNRTDATSGKIDYYRGMGNYEKRIFIDSALIDKRIFLKFNGVNTIANIFVNGKHIGEHRGGYTAFIFELTNSVCYGKNNELLVRVNNAPQLDVMPLLGDFNFYGGIYRDVQLLVTEQACISPLDYASSGVYLSQQKVSTENAVIEAKIKISNPKNFSSLKVRIRVFEEEKLKLEKLVNLEAKQKSIAVLFNIYKPRLWNGVDDPFMYNAEISLEQNGIRIDKVVQALGLRFYRVDADKGFFLNGKHLQLKGVCRHQDRSEFGNALHREHHKEDIEIIKDIGANSIRLSYYPHDPYFYNLLDKNGIVAWSEIPFVGPGGYKDKGFVNQSSFKENGKQQLIEMIRQNFNHPSIIFWGLFNELKEKGDNPMEYIKELNKLAHKEDTYRITTAASNITGNLNYITDLIAWNKYYGWYGGKPNQIGDWADKTHKKHPNLKIGISEYGAGASIYHHDQYLSKPVANSMWHPEEWQAYFHEEHWKAIDKRAFLWGTYIWNLFDFGAAHRTEGAVIGRNDKGLVSFDRKYKKDAFWFYKANWYTIEPFVYIANKRHKLRKIKKTTVKIYSNAKEVELIVNGKSFGKRKGTYGTFLWPDINLKQGENKIEAKIKNKKNLYADTCYWTLNKIE